MGMSVYLKIYGICTAVFFAVDMLWLGVVARDFYRRQVGELLREQVNWPAAILFYLIFIGGIVFFCVLPAVRSGSFPNALLLGALFGLVTYCTYDLTNLATLKGWPLTLVVVDVLWGMTLCTVVSAAGYLAALRVQGERGLADQ